MLTAKTIADYILTRCINNKTYINNRQLQDILYQLHEKDNMLFNGTFKKAEWGHYELDVFYDYIHTGSMPITTKPTNQNLIIMNTDIINQTVDNYLRKE